MKKYLNTNGNSWQLYLSKDLVKLLGITDKDYTVSLNIENNILYVEKSNVDNASNLTKKLIKRGSGYGLNFTIPILELLNINPENDYLDIEFNNKKLIIKKLQNL